MRCPLTQLGADACDAVAAIVGFTDLIYLEYIFRAAAETIEA